MSVDRYYVVEARVGGVWCAHETLYDMTLRQARAAFRRDYDNGDDGAYRLARYTTRREVVR